EPGDVVAARVTSGPVHLILTSIRAPGAPELTVEVEKLDRRDAGSGAVPQPAPVGSRHPAIAQPSQPEVLATEIALHVQNRGDLSYTGSGWAGERGQGLWVEGFAIKPVSGISPGDVEYKGLTSTGVETPWISGGQLCGTRGMGVPLIGFAVRVKP